MVMLVVLTGLIQEIYFESPKNDAGLGGNRSHGRHYFVIFVEHSDQIDQDEK